MLVGGGALLGHLGPLLPQALPQTLVNSLALSLIRDLECSLLNASFGGSNLTLQTPNIQALIFKLGCNFAGLSLNSTTMKRVPQVRGGQDGAQPVPLPPQKIVQGLKVWTPRPPSLKLIWSALIAW